MTSPEPQHDAGPAPAERSWRCPAKVNLALAVGPAQPDGYHAIASWMVAVTFGDTLHLETLPEGPSQWDIHFAADAPAPQLIDWPLEKDLAWRAHQLLEQHADRPLPVRVELSKRIPAGAGLGGGSSNAAAMLVALDELFALNLGQPQLQALARELGSDVVFLVAALHDVNAAVVAGLGERITPVALPAPIDLVLVLPPVRCPTGRVYAAFDEQPQRDRPFDPEAVRRLVDQYPLNDTALFNDLATPACRVEPGLGEAVAQVREATGQPVHVTGSGAAMFLLARSPDDAAALAQRIMSSTNLPSVATRTRSGED